MVTLTTISIIGAGRIGGALAARSAARAYHTHLLSRTTGWEHLRPAEAGPIVVAVRNDDLEGVLRRVPAARHPDLVFVQNGMLRPWLAEHGLEGATRGLLFFAVATRGATPEPGAPSPFTGPHAAALVAWLRALDLPAEVVSADAFAAVELEKLIWNCAFGLLCEVYGAAVGVILDAHHSELAGLVAEFNHVGAAALGIDLDTGSLLDRLVAYSRSIAGYTGAVKEWPWRNGWLVRAAATHGIATPIHDRLLATAGLT